MWTDILFDLDGTLTDSGAGIFNAVRHALGQMGAPVPDDVTLRRFIGPPLNVTFCAVCGFGEDTALEAVERFRDYYNVTGLFENRPYPGIPQLLEKLKRSGRRLHLATAKPLPTAMRVLAHFGLDGFFDSMVGSPAETHGLEKDEIIRLALAEGGIDPKNAVMVGDTAADITGAHDSGLAAIAVTYGYGDPAALAAAGPEFTAGSAEELGRVLLG